MATRRRCANRLAGWSLLTGLVLSCWLAGPGVHAEGLEAKAAASVPASKPTSMPTSMPEITDRGAATPKALLERMANILGEDAKPRSSLSFQPPANRELAKTEMEMALQLGDKARKVTELVQAKIGKMEANMVKSMEGGVQAGNELVLRYQISQVAKDGKVDWDKVKLTEHDAKAQVAIISTGETIPMIKIDGKWYLGEGQETLAKEAEGIKETTGKLMNFLDQIEQKVQSGQITKKNFIQEYQNIVNDSMGPGSK
jgi:hypothetical protein